MEMRILGGTFQEKLDAPMEQFYQAATTLRSRLGEKGYMADLYIKAAFQGLTAKYNPELADDGFDSFGKLRHICVGIVDGKVDDLADVPFKAEAERYLQEKLMGYNDRMTRAALLEIAFFPAFYDWKSAQHFEELLSDVSDECDLTAISGYYEDIAAVLGTAVEVETLTQALQAAFFSITHMEIYRQGMINDLINAMLAQDHESSKPMFSIILDQRCTI